MAGVPSPLFAGGENKPGTGDFRGNSEPSGGKGGAVFFSGDGGSGTLAAVLTEAADEPCVCTGANRFVGEGGWLSRIVSSFSSP